MQRALTMLAVWVLAAGKVACVLACAVGLCGVRGGGSCCENRAGKPTECDSGGCGAATAEGGVAASTGCGETSRKGVSECGPASGGAWVAESEWSDSCAGLTGTNWCVIEDEDGCSIVVCCDCPEDPSGLPSGGKRNSEDDRGAGGWGERSTVRVEHCEAALLEGAGRGTKAAAATCGDGSARSRARSVLGVWVI